MKIKTIPNQRNLYNLLISMILSLTALVFTGCRSDEAGDPSFPEVDGISFKAVIDGADNIGTRANNSVYNVTSDYYPCDFFVRIEGNDYNDIRKEKMSTYVIPSGYEGTILPKDEEPALNWFSRTNPHDFWGWTMPHDPDYVPDESTLREGIKIEFKDTPISELSNSYPYNFAEGSWGNGQILEQLIGGKAGPYIYNENGMYVPLQFRHLVSKIFLMTFNVVNNKVGSTTTGLKGTITFYGLPDEATYYPAPLNSDGSAASPYVAMPEDWAYDQSKGVTYTITNYTRTFKWEGHESWSSNTGTPKDAWYICPEVDFSKLSYKIEIYEYINNEWVLSQTHGKHGAYYGDFRNVVFSRSTNGTNYDDTENPGSDTTILHAGEYLMLKFNINEKGTPGVQGIVTAWASDTQREGSAYVEQGLYSVEQVRDMSSIMAGSDESKIREFFEMNGSGRDTSSDPEGEYPDYKELYGSDLDILELFDDIGTESEILTSSTSSTLKVGSDFRVADGYILDGNGHTVNVNNSTLNIGPMRDVYLRYYSYTSGTPRVYYEYIVYIDKMGNLWTVDPVTFEEVQTEFNVNEMGKNPMKIDLKNGTLS